MLFIPYQVLGLMGKHEKMKFRTVAGISMISSSSSTTAGFAAAGAAFFAATGALVFT